MGLRLRSLLHQELLCQKDFTSKLLYKQSRWEPGIYGRTGEGLVEIPLLRVCPASDCCTDQRDVFVSVNSRFAGG